MDLSGGSSIQAALENVANFDGKNRLLLDDEAGLIQGVIFAGGVENATLRVKAVDACNVKAEALHALGDLDRISVLKNAVGVRSLTGSSVVKAEFQRTANFKGMRCNVTQFVGSLFLTSGGPVSNSKVSIVASDMGNAVAQLTDIVSGGGRVETVFSAGGAVDGTDIVLGGGRVKTVFSVTNDIDSALVSISLDRTGNAAAKDLELREGALIEGILESKEDTIQNSNAKVRLVDSASIFLVGTLTATDSTLLGPIIEDSLTLAAIDLTLKNTAIVKGRLHGVTAMKSTLCADGAAELRHAADKFANSCTLNPVHSKP
eukprot:CAMPEP_0179209210 /NCGR_PEP_ID=MMETSP0796-20121207/104339_1 /TAXON_ID=73915 /ORGANISM="Pyrodinium bahamense, Strain pbaha01" /LENGTH=316 /DNA_ID=CAMNT_0020914167 /DNA_START=1 /DNA_END=948 /DNA_ORIENTATION=+